jgi:hypothetical protein
MFDHIELDPKRRATSDFVEWNPKRHGQKPPYWLPDMLTSVDGKNFARQPNWAWIAGSTYYVPREAVELPRIEPTPEQTNEQRIRAQVIQEIREAVEREAMSDIYNCTIGGGAAQALRIIYAALEKQP